MKNITTFLKSHYPIILFILLFLYIFRKVFFLGLYPIPSDLLVSFFFPYNSGGWENFTDFVAHKEFIASDVVRQIYPWRILAIELMKQGQLPLWNPYAFSGTPLLANIQSAVFYPLNVIFFLFTKQIAWMIYILLQPVLAFFFMYLFIRSLRLERQAAIFAGLAYGFIGYVIIWFELGVVGHTAVWLPLVLWGITNFLERKRLFYILVSVFGLTCSLLAGHAQTAVYIFLITISYYFVMSYRRLSVFEVFRFGSLFILPFGLAAIQLLPSIELLSFSARNAATSAEVFYRLQLPLQHLVMIFAPDFFGNPATKNFWGVDYNEFLGFFGVIALVFACIAIFHSWQERIVRFLLFLAIIALFFALPTPISSLLQVLNVPVLGTGIPARALFIVEFSFVVLSAFGVHIFFKKKISIIPLVVLGGVYAVIWSIVLFFPGFIPKLDAASNLSVAKRNLIIPTVLFLGASGLMIVSRYQLRLRFIVFLLLLFSAAFEYQYLLYKYLPFAPVTYLYPNHPLITKLQDISGTARVFGYDTARLETNLSTEWRLYSAEGYDPLYIRRYGELMASGKKGMIEENIPRSDATFSDSLPIRDSYAKQMLMNVLNVQYIADKIDQPISGPDTSRYPTERYTLLWQQGKWRIYENNKALPHAAVFYNWETKQSDEDVLKTLLNSTFPYVDTLLLTQKLPFRPQKSPITPATIEEYQANRVVVNADAKYNGIIFLSDAYYPGWNAYIDGEKTTLLQVDYALRGVYVKAGKHIITFKYEPQSFYLAIVVSAVSLGIFSLLLFFSLTSFTQKYERKTKKK